MNTETAQKLYNSLMSLANTTYQSSIATNYSLPVSMQYLGKAEAFEISAEFVNSATGNQLTTQLSERQKDINESREEESQAEAQYEMEKSEENE